MDDLTQEQLSVLRSLHFWIRNLIKAKKEFDELEIEKSRDAISYSFERADQLDISFKTQNIVLYASEKNIEFSSLKLDRRVA